MIAGYDEKKKKFPYLLCLFKKVTCISTCN